jgi:predicted transport protein
VPGGNINTLGDHSISHSKQNIDRAISLNSSKTVDRKKILRTVSNTGIYCSSDKVGTVYLV